MGHGYYYECADCRKRLITTASRQTCPDCGGKVENLAISRE